MIISEIFLKAPWRHNLLKVTDWPQGKSIKASDSVCTLQWRHKSPSNNTACQLGSVSVCSHSAARVSGRLPCRPYGDGSHVFGHICLQSAGAAWIGCVCLLSVFTVIVAEEAAAVCKCQVNYDVIWNSLIVGKTSKDKKICIMFFPFLGLNLSSGFILVSCNLS